MKNTEVAQTKSTNVSSFLTNVLNALDVAKVKYCVERNYEEYPAHVTGDVDILVAQNDLSEAVVVTCEAARRSNWLPFIIYETNQAAHLGFYASNYPERYVLVIEYFAGGTWRGFNFLKPERVIVDRERHGITWKPNSSHELIITLVHHLLYNGTVFAKYRDSIVRLYEQDKAKFLVEIASVFGNKVGNRINTLVENQEWDLLEKESHNLRVSLVVRSLLFSFNTTIIAFWGLLSGIRSKPNGILVKVLDDSNSLMFFLESIISVADNWHIFIPPKRQILNVNKNNFRLSRKSATKILRSGGVVIMRFRSRSDDQKISFIERGSIQPFEIFEEGSNIKLHYQERSYRIVEDSPEKMAIVFWDIALNILSNKNENSNCR